VVKRLLLWVLLVLAFAQAAWAGGEPAAWYGDKGRGWFWYETHPEPPPAPKPEPPAQAQPAAPAAAAAKPTATEEMDALRATLEEAKNEAVLRPTPDSLSRYLTLQSQAMDKAMLFTDMWQRVRWSDPSLDYTFQHPVAAGGVRVDRDMTRGQEKADVQAVARENGIFFFFKGNCPYCEEQGRILKALMDEYQLEVVAVSLDGSHNSHFPDAKPDNGIAAKMGVQDAPAMFIVNPDSGEAQPLGYGVIPVDEIESRIRRLVSMQPGQY
jgi:conjugal transfer pilus assembly protein TraF